ncbi:MAG: histidinol-phosphatase HisJ family protein [Candidatus Cloacimonetes bacterium]|nr:histidinol-phosphatase HisJ family protein [Candidatus Cloacimonadota bacterium]
MKIDYHIHTRFSSDAEIDLKELARKAISNGYESIAITDHYDFGAEDIANYGIPPYLKNYAAVDEIRKEFPNLDIMFGVEAGEYHRFHEWADEVFNLRPPDFIIASIHQLLNGRNLSVPFSKILTPEDAKAYYQENLNLVRFGKFHILGHLSIFKRYLSMYDDSHCLPLIEEIFQEIIGKGIALEINFSALGKTLQNVLPEPPLLHRYYEMGGRLITLGSDSHTINQFDTNYNKTVEIVRDCGFTSLFVWKNGQWEEKAFM